MKKTKEQIVINDIDFKLSSKRFRVSDALNADQRTIAEEANSDRGRVLFSASFRRLSQKTQVFAFSLDGARTRLTHSLEVAHVGNYIAETIFKNIDAVPSSNLSINFTNRQAIKTFIEVACLVHDIGNPPFGHFGEKAICNWFNSKDVKRTKWFKEVAKIPDAIYDFQAFDGNKQGFRILTKLQRNMDDEFGLNLTYSQLASTIKYPKFNPVRPTKCSYFLSEQPLKKKIWDELDLNEDERYPLSFLMEASDDIAYCVSDLEDAAEKGLVSASDLKAAFESDHENFEHLSKGVTKARTNLTQKAVVFVAANFQKANLLSKQGLLDEFPSLKILKKVTAQKVYSSKKVLNNEITGFEVIQGLLSKFEKLLHLKRADFHKLAKAIKSSESVYSDDVKPVVDQCTEEPSLIALFPKKHLANYLFESSGCDDKYELYIRTHLIVDFVSGMTDDFALDTYRLLKGQTVL